MVVPTNQNRSNERCPTVNTSAATHQLIHSAAPRIPDSPPTFVREHLHLRWSCFLYFCKEKKKHAKVFPGRWHSWCGGGVLITRMEAFTASFIHADIKRLHSSLRMDDSGQNTSFFYFTLATVWSWIWFMLRWRLVNKVTDLICHPSWLLLGVFFPLVNLYDISPVLMN